MKYEITYLNQSNDFSFHFSKRLRKTCFKTSQVRHDLNHLGFKIINFRVKIFNLYHFGILINNFGQLCIQIILKAKNIEINSLHLCNLFSKQMYQLSFDKLIIFLANHHGNELRSYNTIPVFATKASSVFFG